MVNYILDQGKLRCVFEGRLDTVNCMEFGKELLEKVNEVKSPVVFDLKDVQYVASSFLRICFQVYKGIGDGNLCLINVGPEVKKVLKRAGVDKLIKVD